MLYLALILLAIAAGAWAIPALVKLCSHRELDRLTQRYRQLTFQSPKMADEALKLQIIRLKNMAPGRSEKWYLERVIRELESGRLRSLHEIKK
jgi:hypothetical protein